MQEIIPMIEHTWARLCYEKKYDLKTIDVDKSSPASCLNDLITSNLIVVTCFNTKIARFIKILREKLKIDTRIIFYLHGLATIGLWPLHRFEVLNLLTSHDIFIGTCDGDIKSLDLTLKNAKSLKVPFTIIDLPQDYSEAHSKIPFTFIGRISPQKNLDQLILAYSKLDDALKANHPLWLYGKEDNLGFPNLGLQDYSYLKKLEDLVIQLNLQAHVVFKGFVERSQIQKELGFNYIFVSPSTHSDENFGMAAFRALMSGVPCVLTDWGGHKEFSLDFHNQIYYISPEISTTGPYIDIAEFKEKLISSTKYKNLTSKNYPENYKLENIYRTLNSIIESPITRAESLIPTVLAMTLINQQTAFEKKGDIQRCFKSFSDPAFISFFKAYT